MSDQEEIHNNIDHSDNSDNESDLTSVDDNEMDNMERILSNYFESTNGHNIPSLIEVLVKAILQQNELHSQLLGRLDNLTEALSKKNE